MVSSRCSRRQGTPRCAPGTRRLLTKGRCHARGASYQPRIGLSERVADPVPAADEVLVQVRGCGICGTDLHIPTTACRPRRTPWCPAMTVGSGRCGPSPLCRRTVDDLVAVDASLHCGRCTRCARAGVISANTGGRSAVPAPARGRTVAVPGPTCYCLYLSIPWHQPTMSSPWPAVSAACTLPAPSIRPYFQADHGRHPRAAA